MDDPFRLKEYFEAIKHLNYVVMRGWRDLPKIDTEHPDLDVMVAIHDRQEFEDITMDFDIGFVDLRDPMDNYYPPYIADMMLVNPVLYNGVYVPNPKAYFISLYYHAHIHKRENKYEKELKRAFLDWIPPVVPDDEGVGFFID
jgi:hypothetical protein